MAKKRNVLEMNIPTDRCNQKQNNSENLHKIMFKKRYIVKIYYVKVYKNLILISLCTGQHLRYHCIRQLRNTERKIKSKT